MVMPAEVRLEANSAGKVHQPGQRDRSKTGRMPLVSCRSVSRLQIPTTTTRHQDRLNRSRATVTNIMEISAFGTRRHRWVAVRGN